MESLSFFVSPIGLFLVIAILSVLSITLRQSRRAMSQQRQVLDTLMTGAKHRAHKRIALIIPPKRRGATLEPLFAELASANYKKLELIVVAHHTAGRNAKKTSRRLLDSTV